MADADRSDADLLAELQALRAELDPLNRRREAIYSRRLQLFTVLAGRGVDHLVIASAFAVTDKAVSVALTKERKAAEERKASARSG